MRGEFLAYVELVAFVAQWIELAFEHHLEKATPSFLQSQSSFIFLVSALLCL